MTKSTYPVSEPCPAFLAGLSGGRKTGFSLIEVVMAIGIISFAFVSVLGLLPMGMNSFRNSIDTSIGAEISQRVVNEVQQTDFYTLLTTQQLPRYFDVDGAELKASSSGSVPAGAIYNVFVRVSGSSALPGASANENLATVTVQIANNPSRQALNVNSSTNLAMIPVGVSARTYSTVVSGYYTSP